MSATLSSVEQKVYNKVMASRKKAMTLPQIEAAIPGLSKKELNQSINNILKLKLFTPSRNKDEVVTFHAVAVEDAKKQNTLTEEQQYVLSIVEKAGNKGISKPSIANQVNAEIIARSQVFKALDALEKGGLVKTFKSVNAPTMPLYILQHLKPPEDMAGGVWFDESKEYDSVFVDSLRGVVFNFISSKTFPSQKGKDSISKLCSNPIYPITKTPSLPTPAEILRHIQNNKVTSAPLTVKNVMEIARALELDGLVEAVKPVGGVSVQPMYDSESDGPSVSKRSRRKEVDHDDDLDDDERERRDRKSREKMKAKLKEAKRERLRKERAKEKQKEKERKKKEKEKARKKKEKERKRREREKRKRKEKDKKKKRAVDSDDSDDELRELDDVKPKRKRRAASSDDSDPASSSDSSDISDSDLSDSDTDSDSDSDVSVSSVDSDDLDNVDVALKPKSSAIAGISANPFFSSDGKPTLNDLSDQAVLYRATRRLQISLGQMQAPCGSCPQFSFCEEDGPVNPVGCTYFSDWLAGTNGGWTADVKAEKAKAAQEADRARRRALAEANGETYVEEEANGDDSHLVDMEDLVPSEDEGEY